MSNFAKSAGFTLVELMITIAILAVLMAIVVPNYQLQIQKSRRADAKATLMGEAQRLERCFTDNDTFLGCEASDYNPPVPSYKGHYNISATITTVDGEGNEATASAITAGGYTLTATATGDQANDTRCTSFSINELGQKIAADTDGNDTSADCWN